MRSGVGPGKKKIYEYGNYRDFLRDFYISQKEKDPTFSYKTFSRLVGFKARSFIPFVIQGKRNLTSESIDKLSHALKLNGNETLFFRNLVHLNQATTSKQKQIYAQQLIQSKEYKKHYPLSEAQFLYLSQWYFVAIRELVGLPEFKEDPTWIANRLEPKITTKEAEMAIAELQRLGLIKKNEAGRLIQTDAVVSTPDEVVSAYATQYHLTMLDKAKESIGRFKREMREVSGATICMSSENLEKIKEIIRKCRGEINELNTRSGGYNSVYQLNFQLFPLAPGFKEEKKK